MAYVVCEGLSMIVRTSFGSKGDVREAADVGLVAGQGRFVLLGRSLVATAREHELDGPWSACRYEVHGKSRSSVPWAPLQALEAEAAAVGLLGPPKGIEELCDERGCVRSRPYCPKA